MKGLRGSKEENSSLSTSRVIGIPGIQLPKIEVPTFDRNILNWKNFWEQFESSLHSKPQLTHSDKLTYLRDALKDSPARNIVIGLMQTAESYGEAIKYLQESDSGQELRRLHDLLSQHTRALKAPGNHSLDVYITAAIELKLHESIKHKWTE